MIPVVLPTFRRGLEFVELPATTGARWRFEYAADVFYRCPGLARKTVRCFSKQGVELGRVTPVGIWVNAGYRWNGCTPKRAFLGRWWGAPDYSSTIAASGLHDLLYQFGGCPDFPVDRATADAILERLIDQAGSPVLANVYYEAVTLFGRSCWNTYKTTGVYVETHR